MLQDVKYICNCWFPLFQEIIYEIKLFIFTSHYILPKRFFDALVRMLDDWLTFILFNILFKNTSFIWRGHHCLLRAAISRAFTRRLWSLSREGSLSCHTWPNDYKLRKFLSLKLDFEYLICYWTQSFNNLQMWTKCTLKQIFKISIH